MAKWLNLLLLILFPVAWAAPLLRAAVLPLFPSHEITVLSGVASLWRTDPALAVVVGLAALVAPYLKTLLLAAIQVGRLGPRALSWLVWAGKLAMADVFLIALYIVVIKGMGIGRVETAWGLYLFTFCILLSLALSLSARPKTGDISRA